MKPTTILLAIAFGAAAASQSEAYDVVAPPEIVDAAKLAGVLSRETILFGRQCYYAIALESADRSSCDKTAKASELSFDPVMTVHEWLIKVQAEGATTTSNLPDTLADIEEAAEIMQSIVRISGY